MSALKLLTAASLVILLAASFAVADTSPDRREPIRIEQFEARIEHLLQRIETLEKRLEQLKTALPVAGFRVDEHGILRDGMGHVGGFWGIDNAQIPTAR